MQRTGTLALTHEAALAVLAGLMLARHWWLPGGPDKPAVSSLEELIATAADKWARVAAEESAWNPEPESRDPNVRSPAPGVFVWRRFYGEQNRFIRVDLTAGKISWDSAKEGDSYFIGNLLSALGVPGRAPDSWGAPDSCGDSW